MNDRTDRTHTPGPTWEAAPMDRPGDVGNEWGVFEEAEAPGDKLVCVTYGRKGPERARLIAEAPAGYALAKRIAAIPFSDNDGPEWHVLVDEARAILARAEGR